MAEENKNTEEKKVKGNKVKKTFIGIAAIVVCGAVALSQSNFLGSFVRDKAIEIAKSKMDLNVEMAPINGNPVKGFSLSDIVVSKSGDKLLSVKNVFLSLSYPNLIKGSPKLSVVEIDGVETSVEGINKLISSDSTEEKKEKSDEPADVPVKVVKLTNSRLKTDYGTIELKDAKVAIENSQKFDFTIDAGIKSHDVLINGGIDQKNGSWFANELTAKLKEGSLFVDGSLYPSVDCRADVKELNLKELADFVPQIKEYGIRGILSANGTAKGNAEDVKSIVSQGKGELKKALIKGIPLTDIKLNWDVLPGEIKLNLDQGNVNNSLLKGTCSLKDHGRKKFIDVKADVKNLKFADWNKQIEKETGGTFAVKGKVAELHADISGPIDALIGSMNLISSDIAYKNVLLKDLHGKLNFNGKPTGDLDFSCTTGSGGSAAVSGLFGLAEKSMTDIAYEASNLSIEKIISSLPEAPKGKFAGLINIAGTIKGLANKWKVAADISSPAIEVPEAGKIENIKSGIAYSLESKKLQISKARAEWNDAVMRTSGTLDTAANNKVDFAGTFVNLDLKRLYKLVPALKENNIEGIASGHFKAAGTANDPVVRAGIDYINGSAAGISVPKANAKILYSNNKVNISPATVSVGGGHAVVNCAVSLPSSNSKDIKWTVDGDLKEIGLAMLKPFVSEGDISGKINGKVNATSAGGIKWKTDIVGENVAFNEFKTPEINASAEGTLKDIIIKGISAKFLNGNVDVKGHVGLPPAKHDFSDAKLDIDLEVDKLSIYEFLRKNLPHVHSLQGLLSGKVNINGTVGKPHFNASAQATPLAYRNQQIPAILAECSGNMDEIIINDIHPLLKEGAMKIYAKIFKKNGDWNTLFNIDTKNLDIAQFGEFMPPEIAKNTGGILNVSVKGGGPVSNIRGKGKIHADSIKVNGIEINKLNVPFWLTQEYLIAEEISAVIEKGKVDGGFGYDITQGKWGGNFTVMSSDLHTLVKHAVPDLDGNVTGIGDLKIRFGGDSGRASTIKASGAMQLHDGSLADFEALKSASKVIGGKPIRFENVTSAFTYDGGDINILPGTQATAPAGDKFYSHAMLDGFISHKKDMSLFAMGKVNVRALNSVIGAFDTLAAAGSSLASGTADKNELLQGVLGGMVKGFAKNEFRFVTLGIGGTTDNPKIRNLKITQEKKPSSAKAAMPNSGSDPDLKKTGQNGGFTFKFKFEIPVGPGGRRQITDAKGQAIGQSIENLINNLEF